MQLIFYTLLNSQDLAESVNDFHIGGVAGFAFANVIDCTSYADINSTSENEVRVGGLIGTVGSGSEIKNCSAYGTVNGKKNNYVGGAYGYAVGNHERVHFGGKIVENIPDVGTGAVGIFIGHAYGVFQTKNCSYSKLEGSFPVIGKNESTNPQDIKMK